MEEKLMEEEEERKLLEEVADQILMAERVESAVEGCNSFRMECHGVGRLVGRLRLGLQNLFSIISTAAQPLYDRPIVRIVAQVSKNLERALTLVRKCKCRLFAISNRTIDLHEILNLLESSIADLNWLLSFIDLDTGCAARGEYISLPPIAINDPVISWVWSFIAIVRTGKLTNRIDAANNIASLAQSSERNKTVIVEEGGFPPLLKLLKNTSPAAQIAATSALYNLADKQERVKIVVEQKGVPIIAQLLRAAAMKVQIPAANLVARMAENDNEAQKAFAKEQVIGLLLKLLSFEIISDEPPITQLRKHKQSIHSVIEMQKEIDKHNSVGPNLENHSRYTNFYLNWYFEGSNRAKQQKKEWEMEKPEVRLRLKINCSKALWMLARRNVSICKNITERNGLMWLAKLIEKEQGELQFNCLMTVTEITVAAEIDASFRHSSLKTNSPGVRAVVDQLLRIIKESDSPELQNPAIKSIGSLARIFPARETRVIDALVARLGGKRRVVAEEVVIALKKFVCPENFLSREHTDLIIKLNGRAALTRLIEKGSQEAKVLLGYLDSTTSGKALKPAGELTAAEKETDWEPAPHQRRRERRRSENCRPHPLNPFWLVVVLRDKDVVCPTKISLSMSSIGGLWSETYSWATCIH